MQLILLCCLAAGGDPSTPVVEKPATAERGEPAAPLFADAAKGELLVWCVRAGMPPNFIEEMFGPPLLWETHQDAEMWWYPKLGVRVYFPPSATQRWKPLAPERIHGGIY